MAAQGNAYISGANYLYSPDEHWQLNGRPYNPANITLTTSDNMQTGFEAENVLDGLTASRARQVNPGNQWFKFEFPQPVEVNAFGFAGSNLYRATGHQWRAAWSDDDISYTPVGPWRTEFGANGDFYIDESVGGTHPFWRVSLNHTDNLEVYVGVIYLGDFVRLYNPPNPGFAAPPLNSRNRLLPNFSQGGSLLGTSVLRRGGQTEYVVQDVPWDWLNNEWRVAYDRIVEGEPFFVTWDLINAPGEAAYGIAPQNPAVSKISHDRGSVSISMLTV